MRLRESRKLQIPTDPIERLEAGFALFAPFAVFSDFGELACADGDVIEVPDLYEEDLEQDEDDEEAPRLTAKQRKLIEATVCDEKHSYGVAGAEYLWDGYGESLRQIGRRRVKDGFRPKRLSWAVRRIFEEYEAEHPDRTKLTPHDLRGRAITILVEKTQSIDATAEALNVTAATVKRHYLDRQKAFRSQELLKKMAEVLVPPPAPVTGGDPA